MKKREEKTSKKKKPLRSLWVSKTRPKFAAGSLKSFLTAIQMNALTMAYGLTWTEFIPKVRFTFSLPKPRHFYSFFFPFPRVTILTRTFPRTETFSINYIPLAAASLWYLISYLSPRIQRTVFQPPRLANSHGRKKKKEKRERKEKRLRHP